MYEGFVVASYIRMIKTRSVMIVHLLDIIMFK